LALLLTTRCPPLSDITHGPDDVYSDDAIGHGSGPDSARDRGDVEGHLLEHAARSEAGWSSLHDEKVHERQGVKSRCGFYSPLFSFVVYFLSLFLPRFFFQVTNE